MFSKRQVYLGALALVLTTFLLTTSAFLYFFHLVSGDVALTVKFFRALQVVKARYVEDVPTEQLMNGAINGLVRSLNDAHSMYLDGTLFQQFMVETEGQFGGIGIVVGVKDGLLTVVSPIEGTPGEKIGIQSGDKILKINGEFANEMPLDVAVGKIRGPKDTFVELVLLRGEEEMTYSIMRTNIKLKSVAAEKVNEELGYVRIRMFNEHTAEEFAEAMAGFDQESIQGIILDLRRNPGGLLDSCVKVAEYFVPQGPVVSIAGRTGNAEVLYSHNKNPKYKVVVLVDEGSASASEIVAAAIQDTGVGEVIGTTTYGKGSVQAILRLDSESAVKLTCATYFTPAGRAINGVGVTPDIIVANETAQDSQLEKAKEALLEMLAKSRTEPTN